MACKECEERRKAIAAQMNRIREWARNGFQGPRDPKMVPPIRNAPAVPPKVDKPEK